MCLSGCMKGEGVSECVYEGRAVFSVCMKGEQCSVCV